MYAIRSYYARELFNQIDLPLDVETPRGRNDAPAIRSILPAMPGYAEPKLARVITSYSIHYTKLYDGVALGEIGSHQRQQSEMQRAGSLHESSACPLPLILPLPACPTARCPLLQAPRAGVALKRSLTRIV